MLNKTSVAFKLHHQKTNTQKWQFLPDKSPWVLKYEQTQISQRGKKKQKKPQKTANFKGTFQKNFQQRKT